MDYQAILMTIIAFSAFLSVLAVIFKWLLDPLKDNQRDLKEALSNHITDTNKKIDKLDDRIDKLDDRIDKLETKIAMKIDKLETKIDRVIKSLSKA